MELNIQHPTVVPIVGNLSRIILRYDHFTDAMKNIYNDFREERFIGSYEFMSPNVMLRDLELIKNITIKDFEHFLDHKEFSDESVEPVFSRTMISLKGEEWKDMRSAMSPAFTSSKIRLMVPFMEEVGKQMTEVMMKDITESKSGYIDVDIKDLTSRFANDVIATCAFGLKVDSYSDRDNKFYKTGKSITSFTFKQVLMFFANSAFPAIAKRLKIRTFADETIDFFRDIVLGTMKERDVHKIIRPDMIHLLMQAKKGNLSHDDKATNDADVGFAAVKESSVGKKNIDRVWSDTDLVAQALIFLIAGLETLSTGMSFGLHELALHPEIQERLVEEIKEYDAKNNGKIDYTSIQHMQYMDMVVSEILRIWPPALLLDRICVKDYNLGKANDKAEDYIIRKGESLSVPVFCIHRDPDYYPDPMKFDPERFSDENKHLIHPMAYMPFGLGPRNCIGSRFALCELKVFLYTILLNMEVSPNEKTCTSGKISIDSFNFCLEGGHWLRFTPRS